MGGNISGTSDLAPLDQQAAMIQELFPDAKNIGLLYCSAEANSQYQVDEMTKYLTELGLTATAFAFTDTNDVASVAQAACDASDVHLHPHRQHRCLPTPRPSPTWCCRPSVPVIAGEAGHLLGLRRRHPVHQLLRSGRHHRQDGREDPHRRGGHLPRCPWSTPLSVTKMYNAANCEALGVTIPDGYAADRG